MTANTKTTWSVWGILFGMAIVLGIGVAFLAFTLTRDPQMLALLYDKITVPQSLHSVSYTHLGRSRRKLHTDPAHPA